MRLLIISPSKMPPAFPKELNHFFNLKGKVSGVVISNRYYKNSAQAKSEAQKVNSYIGDFTFSTSCDYGGTKGE